MDTLSPSDFETEGRVTESDTDTERAGTMRDIVPGELRFAMQECLDRQAASVQDTTSTETEFTD